MRMVTWFTWGGNDASATVDMDLRTQPDGYSGYHLAELGLTAHNQVLIPPR